MKIFDVEKGYEALEYFAKNTPVNKLYMDKYAPRHKIGFCVQIYHRIKPSDLMDFATRWFTFAEMNTGVKIFYRGATEDEIIRYANEMHDILLKNNGVDAPVDKLTYLLLHHMITETYVGASTEDNIMEYIKSLGLKCRKSLNKSNEETVYGVDIFLLDENGKETCAIQVKPFKFLNSRRQDVAEHRVDMKRKYERLKNDKGLETLYIVYRGFPDGIYLLNNKNKNTFKFNELWVVGSDDSVNMRNEINLNKSDNWKLLKKWQKSEI